MGRGAGGERARDYKLLLAALRRDATRVEHGSCEIGERPQARSVQECSKSGRMRKCDHKPVRKPIIVRFATHLNVDSHQPLLRPDCARPALVRTHHACQCR